MTSRKIKNVLLLLNGKEHKKGFTLIELMLSLSIGLLLVYGILYIPLDLLKSYKDFDRNSDYFFAVQTLHQSFMKDISADSNLIEYTDTSITLGESVYTIESDGLYLERDSKLRLTKLPIEFSVENDVLIVLLKHEDKTTKLKYNLYYSSFE